ncbi:MAG: hypothetical protein WC408_05315 [Candidatus Micrarchaeia archaeon]|jgi:hypothetical protein
MESQLSKERIKHELDFCLELWEKQGHCGFGGKTNCEECAAPYLCYKLLTGKALHDKGQKRLTLSQWKALLEKER